MAPVDVGSLEPHEPQLNDSENISFDIFENSSPQRPIHASGSAGHATEVNFSRKRTYDGRISNVTEPSKRPRPTDWPLSPSKQNRTATPILKHQSTQLPNPPSSNRASKFREASMHDRPSVKPPSVFTRTFKAEGQNDMEVLMENYMASLDSTLPKHTVDQEMQMKGITHHPNMSITSSATGQTVESAHGKKSSIFRFGRSMASAFNPLTIWNSLSANWHHTKEEPTQEAQDDRQKEWDERKSKAEQAYAELKKAGYRGTKSQDCDSGIELDDKSRSSSEQESNAGLKMRRPSFHLRTPSLSSLRRIASDVNLHKRSRSASTSMSPEKQDVGEIHGLHHSSSKWDLNRQAKLTKRVSDLEAKLEAARKELLEVMGDVPPVPPIPTVHTTEAPKSRPTSSRRIGFQRKFAPLPTLPSESLLCADTARVNIPDIAEQYFEAEAKEDANGDISADSEGKEPSKIKYAFNVKDEFKEIEKHDKVILSTPKKLALSISFPNTPSPKTDDANSTSNKATPVKAKITKRRKSHEADHQYKTAAEFNNNDKESTGAAPAAKKPKRCQQYSDQPFTNTTSKTSPSANTKQPTVVAPPTKFPSRRSSKPHVLSKPLPSIDAITTTAAEANSPRTPRHRHQRSLSPEKVRSRLDYRQRSQSPPHMPALRRKGGHPEVVVKTRKGMDDVFSVVPDGKDVPPMPKVASSEQIEKDEWVWPEDVF